jgi:hypothetical protein
MKQNDLPSVDDMPYWSNLLDGKKATHTKTTTMPLKTNPWMKTGREGDDAQVPQPALLSGTQAALSKVNQPTTLTASNAPAPAAVATTLSPTKATIHSVT